MTPQQQAAQVPPVWTGDLDDDCSARWAGMTLRAECMDGDRWWWAVYDISTGEEIVSQNSLTYGGPCHSGQAARLAAEKGARIWLGLE